jgi:Membrane domain of glycerophosphoryl diester phosphodiesterase
VATAGTPVRLRPLPVGELLDETFKLYRTHFNVIAGVAIVIILPNLLLTLLSGSYRANPLSYLTQLIQNANDQAALQRLQNQNQQYIGSPLYLLSFPVAILLYPFTGGALYRAATSLAAGNVETIGSVLIGTARRYFAMFGLVILTGLVVLGGIAIITIPIVIWVLIRWAVDTPALFAEGIGPVKALGRSWFLTRDHWWRTLGILLLVGLMVSLIQTALGALFTGVAALIPGVSDDLRAGLVTTVATLIGALVGAISPIAITLLYLDLRVRKEGLDLDQLARQASPGTAPA